MIVRERPNWLMMLFVVRGSVLPTILPQLIVATAFAVAVTSLHGRLFDWKVSLNFVPFSLIGLTLAIFLGFRNSTSYARFWEARTFWGTLQIETRAMVRQSMTLVDSPSHVHRLSRLLIAFTHALRHQLRSSDPATDLARLLPEADVGRVMNARFRPAMLLLLIGEWLRDRRLDGSIDPALVPAMEHPLRRLTEVLGGCERIASTPIPFTYAVLIHRTVYFYCLMLPFGLVDAIGVMTPVIVAFISYTFFALEALAGELEEPFGDAPNDLALDAMSWTIEASVLDLLGEAPTEAARSPVGYVVT